MKLPKLRKLSFLLVLIPFVGLAQQRKCANEAMPWQKRYADVQRVIEQVISERQLRTSNDFTEITIPVVVHVIHNNPANTIGGRGNPNISDEQIFSQIKVLNEDYRRLPETPGFNVNPVGADLKLNFKLATFDPDGLPSTGINRVYSPQSTFNVFSEIGKLSELSYWPSDRYLNIWVTTLSDNYIGYAEFPTGDFDGLDFAETNPATDGIVIEHSVFGRRTGTAAAGAYSYGRTLTHEIGHWFGLLHTWGDEFCGDDYCADTPPTQSSNNTLFCQEKFSSCNGIRTRNMIENFLDYSPDSCMNVFTQNQSERIRAILGIAARRGRLVKSAQINNVTSDTPELRILSNPNVGDKLKIQVVLPDFSDFTLKVFNLKGQLVAEKNYADYPGLVIPFKELCQESGLFYVVLAVNRQTITKKIVVLN